MPKQTFFNLNENKQEKIINAAIEEFALNSFEKATIDNIVKKACIPKGSFYQYFENKEDVYKYLFKFLSGKKYKELEMYLSKLNEMSFSEFIRMFYISGIDFNFQDSSRVKLGEKFLYNCSSELREEILELMIPDSNALLEKVLKHYMTKGELREELNTALAAEMLTAITIFVSKSLKTELGKSKKYIMDTIEEMIKIIENGIKNN